MTTPAINTGTLTGATSRANVTKSQPTVSAISANMGVRYEFEQGLREANNAFTVGFDREQPFPIQVSGLNLKGGLVYAGVDGHPTSQGSPSHLNFGPRGVFIAITIAFSTLAVVSGAVFRRGRWKRKVV